MRIDSHDAIGMRRGHCCWRASRLVVRLNSDLAQHWVVPPDAEAIGLLLVTPSELSLTFIGRLLGNRSFDSNAWLMILCRGRVTRWDTWIGSEPRYTIWS